MMSKIVLVEGDITEQVVDAIVNAANNELVLGSGVAGAIRDRGGRSIEAECSAIGSIEIGQAAVTGAGDLPARFVIHAAAMTIGGAAEELSIRNCVKAALSLAVDNGCRTVAFPAIGAGVGGFSLQRCAEISIEEVRRHQEAPSCVEEIRFVLLGEPAYRVFEMALDAEKVAAQMRLLGDRG